MAEALPGPQADGLLSPISDKTAKNMIMQFMGYPKSWA